MKKLLLTLLAISMMAFVGCTAATDEAAPADDSADVVEPAADAAEDAMEDAEEAK